ncbi:serine hydrolase domain-containing protein [Streptacidiphilus monticola]|uniref:Serine hydrolase domain-containing protein n=1 Tax=Streptacidiphilus monticola TaxID=2161674 RepID=A0ABW1G0X4_9ACTN
MSKEKAESWIELLPETRRALLRRIAVAQAEGRVPGLVAGVLREGELVWQGARSCVPGHEPDADVQFRIGSITKTFVAVLVLRLRDEGLLTLADPVGSHLPGLPEEVAGVSVAQLLCHSSGLSNEPSGPWWERTEGALRPELADLWRDGSAERHPAGRVFHYSNLGYGLLGALVERLRDGEHWFAVLRREVLEPLGMARTTLLAEAPHAGGWAVHPWADVLLPEPSGNDTGRMAPAGQLWSTLADLARWARFLTDGDEKVLSRATLAEMRVHHSGTGAADWDSYGLGLQRARTPAGVELVGHTGSMPGFLAALWTARAEGLAAVVLANTTAGLPGGIGKLAADLVSIVDEREPRIPEPWRPIPEAELDRELLELTGPWFWGPTGYTLRLRPGRVLELVPMSNTATREARLLPNPDGRTWRVEADSYWHGETLRVVRTEAGVHLDLGTFVLTREPYPAVGPTPGGVDPEGWRGL